MPYSWTPLSQLDRFIRGGFWLRRRRGEIGGPKALRAARAGAPSRRSGWPRAIRRTILFALAAIGTSGIVAAWITKTDFPTLASAALPADADDATFEDRFLPGQRSDRADVAPLNRFVLASAEPGLPTALDALSLRWLPQDFRTGSTDDAANFMCVTEAPVNGVRKSTQSSK